MQRGNMAENDKTKAGDIERPGYLPPSPEKRPEGKGTWQVSAFHLATTIATPAAFAPLPYAMSQLGWPGGVVTLLMGTAVTYYCTLILASLWDWNEPNRYVRYRDLGRSIYGAKGYWSVLTFQQIASIGNNITIQIVAGLSMKSIYLTYTKEASPSMTLQHFIIIFGCAELILSQFPDIHSLRFLNALCTGCTIGFSVSVVALCSHALRNGDAGHADYNIVGSPSGKMFGVFSALGTVAFSFGDAMLPEIQATLREPAKTNMYKGASLAYGVIAVSYWTVAFMGYAVFGNAVNPYLVNSFIGPSWLITLANIFAVVQVLGCYQIYCRPTYLYVEQQVMDYNKPPLSIHNCLVRLGVTTVYIVVITVIAAAIPFFGDFVALCGAIGFTPLDFIIPVIAFLKVRNPKNPLVKLINVAIVVVYSIVAVLGAIGAIQFIHTDTARYKFFANM
ncbi:hypothetical protein M758_3G105800 [Ceratodon purpureus]|nr:hypothetical protein M758_3G105800 [Ceratodon purpureus]